jgi:hypothetical protein
MGGIPKEAAAMSLYHQLSNLHFRGEFLVITIDGEEKQFPIKQISAALAQASEFERNNFEISPSGYGIHWPLIDEDLSIDGLLGIVHKPGLHKKSA